MNPDSDNTVVVSSNPDDANDMKDVGGESWTSSSSDTTPTVTIQVADEDSFIKTVEIDDVHDSVTTVNVAVYNKNNEEV